MPAVGLRTASNDIEMLDKMKNTQRAQETMVTVFADVITQVAKVILPGDPAWLFQSLYVKLPKILFPNIETIDPIRILTKMMKSLFYFVKELPHHRMAYRTARAIIIESASKKDLDDNFSDAPIFGKDARTRGLADYCRMFLLNKDPKITKRKICRIDPDVLEAAVEDILSSVNVGTLSWGIKKAKIPNTNMPSSGPTSSPSTEPPASPSRSKPSVSSQPSSGPTVEPKVNYNC
jgi:hypothetical protein